MSSTINQDGTIPEATTGGTAAPTCLITSSTNAAPIVVQTTSPHGCQDGDTVRIEGHLTNTAANGLWTVLVGDSTHVTLLGSTGNGVGGATGILYDYAINPVITIPSDGDLANGASVKPAFAGTFNLAPFLYERTGKYNLRNQYLIQTPFAGGNPFASWTTQLVPNTNTWTTIAGTSGLLAAALGYAPVYYGRPASYDFLDISFTTTQSNDCASNNMALGLGISLNGGAYAYLVGSSQVVPYATSLSGGLSLVGFSLCGSSAVQGQTFDLCLMGFVASAASVASTVALQGDWTLNVKQLRANN